MTCLQLKTDDIERKTFLTKEEKLVFLYRLFLRERAKHKNAVFVPSDSFYADSKIDDLQLQSMGKELLSWLGVKHNNLSIRFSTDSNSSPVYIHDKHKPQIVIPYSAYDKPYYCSALLAHTLMHYFLLSRHRIVLDDDQDEDFVDLACISAGLGIILMNGFITHKKGLDRLFGHNHLQLPGMNVNEIKSETKHFLTHNPVPRNAWLATALPGARLALNENTDSLPTSPYVYREQQKLHRSRLISILTVTGIVFVIGVSILLAAASPKNMPPEQQARKEKIETLRLSYEICMSSVAKKKQTLNQDDIFMLRAIEKDEKNCKSIMNKHNYEVDQYNKYWQH